MITLDERMKANYLLKHNIDAMLRARGQRRKDLAGWCRRSESWLSQIFKEDRREIPLKYLDRIADFFGVATYQLFQPGITHLTERRKRERRTGRDRRVSRLQLAVPDTGSVLVETADAEVARLMSQLKNPKNRASVLQALAGLVASERIGAQSGGGGETAPAPKPPQPTRARPYRPPQPKK